MRLIESIAVEVLGDYDEKTIKLMQVVREETVRDLMSRLALIYPNIARQIESDFWEHVPKGF